MKKAFTLLELIVVLVILGIVGSISIEILQNTYKNYVVSRQLNSLSAKTDLVLNLLAVKLKDRIKNSVIVVECNATNTDTTDPNSCISNTNKNFISISNVDNNNNDKYPVLVWLHSSVYSKRGLWNDTLHYNQPGWSGFVDLKVTDTSAGGDEYNITTPESNFTNVQIIDGNLSQAWGVSGYDKIFDNNISVLVFSGSDGRGDFSDVNTSYGYFKKFDSTKLATRVFSIKPLSDTRLNIKAIDESNSTTVYEGYYIVDSAMALLPVYNQATNDYNLTLMQNYYPWKKQIYLDGNKSVVATHVTQFKFKQSGGVLRLYICISSPEVKLSDVNLTICKEKVVF